MPRGVDEHVLCREARERQQGTPLILIQALNIESMSRGAEWLRNVRRLNARHGGEKKWDFRP